ncbi:hypothetical protein BG004_000702 [Podila humilis]|nr:hypothetical protein BG004_000702 [Podila humilis]
MAEKWSSYSSTCSFGDRAHKNAALQFVKPSQTKAEDEEESQGQEEVSRLRLLVPPYPPVRRVSAQSVSTVGSASISVHSTDSMALQDVGPSTANRVQEDPYHTRDEIQRTKPSISSANFTVIRDVVSRDDGDSDGGGGGTSDIHINYAIGLKHHLCLAAAARGTREYRSQAHQHASAQTHTLTHAHIHAHEHQALTYQVQLQQQEQQQQQTQDLRESHRPTSGSMNLTRSKSLPSVRSSLSSTSLLQPGLTLPLNASVTTPEPHPASSTTANQSYLQLGQTPANPKVPDTHAMSFLGLTSSTQSSLETQPTRPRRQSLLTPIQMKRMSDDRSVSATVESKMPKDSINRIGKSFSSKVDKKLRGRSKTSVSTIPLGQQQQQAQEQQQQPSVHNTPTLTFQPHHTEISTDRPSVSGRLLLRIPKLPNKSFEFVSLTLTLRLKESIAWTRQDLTSFEIQKESWSQTAWEKSMQLQFRDKQVEEGEETIVKCKDDYVSNSAPSSPKPSVELSADEWRWEWLMPVTKNEVWPESFEGSMGMVWYEMEAKCHFRWIIQGGSKEHPIADFVYATNQEKTKSKNNRSKSLPRSSKLKIGKVDHNVMADVVSESSSNTAKSLAHVFGKLRSGNKGKKSPHTTDFKIASTGHEKYLHAAISKPPPVPISRSLSDGSMALTSTIATTGGGTEFDSIKPQVVNSHPPPLPFLIRKSLKLYFVRPPPRESANKAFFLPPPSMALPILPGTRRLKAIIPGARIQVQIQIPTIIPIPGYAQTSQLVPCAKTGVLVPSKGTPTPRPGLSDHSQGYGLKGRPPLDSQKKADSSYPDNFQVALTIRKVTQTDIKSSESLRRRYEYVGTQNPLSSSSPVVNSNPSSLSPGNAISSSSIQGFVRKRMMSQPQITVPPSLLRDSHDVKTAASVTVAVATEKGKVDVDAAVEQTAIYSDESRGTIANETESPSKSHNTSWRKEICVRKVACEFWQKESCRIPTDDGASRSIKVPLGPAFIYQDKDHVDQDSAPTTGTDNMDAERNYSGTNTQASLNELGSFAHSDDPLLSTISRVMQDHQNSGSVSLTHSESDLRGGVRIGSGGNGGSGFSNGALAYPAGSSQIQQQPNKPFTLLVPVPLDSIKLRQTFAWPSTATPSPVHVASSDPSLSIDGRTSEGLGFGSEIDYPSVPTFYPDSIGGGGAGVGGASRPGTGFGFGNVALVNVGGNSKARIEMKHYLTFRISIDMLEFEGELEDQEILDNDNNVNNNSSGINSNNNNNTTKGNSSNSFIEYHHSQCLPNSTATTKVRQDGAGIPIMTASTMSSTFHHHPPFGISPPGSPKRPSSSANIHNNNNNSNHSTGNNGGRNLRCNGTTSSTSNGITSGLISGASSVSSGRPGYIHDRSICNNSIHHATPSATATSTTPPSTRSMATLQPALTFLNSTAGLLDLDDDEHHHHTLTGEMDVSTSACPISPVQFTGPGFDGSQRRGSKGSLGTVQSTSSGNTIGLYSAKTTSSISDSSHGSQIGGGGGGGGGLERRPPSSANNYGGVGGGESLVAGAIGAIKKKASNTLMMSGYLSPQTHTFSQRTIGGRASGSGSAPDSTPVCTAAAPPTTPTKVSVKKLKDFVIRVPINVVVKVADQNRVAGGAFGEASSCGDQNGTATETNESAVSTSAERGGGSRDIGKIEMATTEKDFSPPPWSSTLMNHRPGPGIDGKSFGNSSYNNSLSVRMGGGNETYSATSASASVMGEKLSQGRYSPPLPPLHGAPSSFAHLPHPMSTSSSSAFAYDFSKAQNVTGGSSNSSDSGAGTNHSRCSQDSVGASMGSDRFASEEAMMTATGCTSRYERHYPQKPDHLFQKHSQYLASTTHPPLFLEDVIDNVAETDDALLVTTEMDDEEDLGFRY